MPRLGIATIASTPGGQRTAAPVVVGPAVVVGSDGAGVRTTVTGLVSAEAGAVGAGVVAERAAGGGKARSAIVVEPASVAGVIRSKAAAVSAGRDARVAVSAGWEARVAVSTPLPLGTPRATP